MHCFLLSLSQWQREGHRYEFAPCGTIHRVAFHTQYIQKNHERVHTDSKRNDRCVASCTYCRYRLGGIVPSVNKESLSQIPFHSILINFRWQAILCFALFTDVITTACEKVANSVGFVYGRVYTCTRPCTRPCSSRVHGRVHGHVHGRVQVMYTYTAVFYSVLFCSLTVPDPRVGHTMDVLSPLISILCHSDWLFHRESCPRLDVVYPGHAWSSSPACTWHCSLHYFFPRQFPCFLMVWL